MQPGIKQIPWNRCDSCYSNFFWADSRDTCTKKFQKDQELQRVLTILELGDQNLGKKKRDQSLHKKVGSSNPGLDITDRVSPFHNLSNCLTRW